MRICGSTLRHQCGDAHAVKGRAFIAKQMTAADISKAQGLARECVGKKYKGC